MGVTGSSVHDIRARLTAITAIPEMSP